MNDAFKALADPTRRKILELLSEQERNAGDIAACFHISKPSISHHLGILKSAGLVEDERQGQNIMYSLNLTVFQEMMKWFFDFTGFGVQNKVYPMDEQNTIDNKIENLKKVPQKADSQKKQDESNG